MSDETKSGVPKKELPQEAYEVKLPRNCYKLRCIEASNEKSKKAGHRMAKLTCEIIDNDLVKHGEKEVDINGLELIANSVVTEKSLKFANATRAAFGLPDLNENDVAVFDAKEFQGRTCFAICQSTLTEQINDITGEPILNPYTKEKLTTMRREIVDWIPKPAGYE